MSKIQPVGPRLLVKFIEREIKKGQLILTNTNTDPHQRGLVISIGTPDNNMGAILVKKGDLVLFPRYCAQEMDEDGEKLYMVKYQDILAVINN